MAAVKCTTADKLRYKSEEFSEQANQALSGFYGSADVTNLPPLQESPLEPGFQIVSYLNGDRNEVFRYYSAENTEQTILYYSADEDENPKSGSPGETQYFRYSKDGKVAMGSGTSIMEQTPGGKHMKQKKSRRSSSGSDNGGFETGTPKPVLGVREKLRSSLDKINIRVPFKWNSSDKLSGKDSKQKSRRSSDSVFSGLESKKKVSRSPSHSSELEGVAKRTPVQQGGYLSRGNSADHRRHDYVNICDVAPRLASTQGRKPRHSDIGVRTEARSNHAVADYYVMHGGKHQRESPPKSKKVPLKSEPYSPYASLLSESSGTLSSGTLQEHVDDRISSPSNRPTNEPPRLAPSGMLLLDKVTEGTIIRPTAFKPTEKGKNWPALISPEGSVASPSHPQPRNSVARFSVSTNDSDSGRNSATSMLVGASNGSSFSCSGSEGYESARVSSSTNHSTSVAEADHVLSSPKGVTDDVTTPESDPYDLMLRHNYNDIEKPLQKVVEETSETREFEINELKQVYSKQLKSQARKSTVAQQRLQRQIDRLQEDKQQSHHRLAELEERIKSMNEAIDAQSRMNDDIAQLRARLEESEWERQQKYGELSMLKSQLKDIQAESAQRGSEIVALRTRNRELQALVARRDAEAVDLNEKLNDRNLEIGELEQRLSEASSPAGTWHRSPGSISPQSLRNPSGTFSEPNPGNWHDDRNYLSSSSPPGALTSLKRDELIKRLYEAEARCNEQEKFFNIERRQWADDKSRVIRYQKQLQANYVQTYKRCGALEREVKLLTPQQQRSSRTQQRQTKEHAAELSYPMEI